MHRERKVLCRSLMTDVTENVLGLLKVLKRKSRSLWKWLCSFASIAASFIGSWSETRCCCCCCCCWQYTFNHRSPSSGNIKNVLRLSGKIRWNSLKKKKKKRIGIRTLISKIYERVTFNFHRHFKNILITLIEFVVRWIETKFKETTVTTNPRRN